MGGPVEMQPGASLVWAVVAVFDGDQVVLVTAEGEEWGRGPRNGWTPEHPDRGADLIGSTERPLLVEAPALDGPLPGCGAVHGRGGVRVAVCGDEHELPAEIHLVAMDGRHDVLAGPAGELGHWRYALPSPDGRWVLAQWSGECEVPVVYLFDVNTGRGGPIEADAVASTAVGWTERGDAIVTVRAEACGEAAERPGAWLVDPVGGERRHLHDADEAVILTDVRGRFANRLERVMSRARDELGLEDCCAQPSHGGTDAEWGYILDGEQISVNAVPLDDLNRPLPPPDSVRLEFDCGPDRYFLRHWADRGRTPTPDAEERLLKRATRRLTPGLYCTPGPVRIKQP